jgi:hypothetical protein
VALTVTSSRPLCPVLTRLVSALELTIAGLEITIRTLGAALASVIVNFVGLVPILNLRRVPSGAFTEIRLRTSLELDDRVRP